MPEKFYRTIDLDNESQRDLRLLSFVEPGKIKPEQWQRGCVLLLICHTSREREIVGLHVLHNLPMQTVADAVQLPLARVLELWNSVAGRGVAARSRVFRDSFLASHFNTPTGERRKLKKRKKS